MSSRDSTRHGVTLSISSACLLALVVHSCGGGGGGSGGGVPQNTRPGQMTTPGASATPTPATLIVAAGESIAEAIKRAPSGSTLIVSPGTYGPVVLAAGDAGDAITLVADVTGKLTDSAAAPVTISAQARPAAISLSGQTDLTIDGFTIRGGQTAALLVTNSPGTAVLNCIVTQSTGDGIRFQQSNAGLIFNSIVSENRGAGIHLRGSDRVRVINNTIYNNSTAGLSADSSTVLQVTNNIMEHNTPAGIIVDSSVSALTEDFNLNNDGYRGAAAGPNDIVGQDPLFTFPDGGDFHVQAVSGGATSPAVDSGDPDTDPDLVALLVQGATQSDGMSDVLPVDLGYHYPQPPATPTPRPRASRTSTPRGTPAIGGSPTRTPAGPSATPTTTPAGRPTRTLRPTRTPRV